jgi:hypothetical protein
VPVGDGKGLLKLVSGSGMLIRKGGRGRCFDGEGSLIDGGTPGAVDVPGLAPGFGPVVVISSDPSSTRD